MLVFCKSNFKKHAASNIKRIIPNEHLEVLDGMDVEFNDSDEYGEIPYYLVPNDDRVESFYLYPVDKKWCRQKQLVFDF